MLYVVVKVKRISKSLLAYSVVVLSWRDQPKTVEGTVVEAMHVGVTSDERQPCESGWIPDEGSQIQLSTLEPSPDRGCVQEALIHEGVIFSHSGVVAHKEHAADRVPGFHVVVDFRDTVVSLIHVGESAEVGGRGRRGILVLAACALGPRQISKASLTGPRGTPFDCNTR